MADWKAYAKAARNTAKKQAPGVKEAVGRSVNDGVREVRTYSRAASKVAGHNVHQGRESGQRSMREARKTMRATAVVAERHYRRSRIGTRLLRALRDASLMAMSVLAIWFVFSRVFPIPFTAVAVIMAVLVVLRFGWALFHNEFEPADPQAGDAVPESDLPPRAKTRG